MSTQHESFNSLGTVEVVIHDSKGTREIYSNDLWTFIAELDEQDEEVTKEAVEQLVLQWTDDTVTEDVFDIFEDGYETLVERDGKAWSEFDFEAQYKIYQENVKE